MPTEPKHTPTPWAVGAWTSTRRLRIVSPSETRLVGTVGHEADDAGVADAHRIVACVNACEGIDDPAAVLSSVKNVLLVLATRPVADSPEMARTNEALARAALDRLGAS